MTNDGLSATPVVVSVDLKLSFSPTSIAQCTSLQHYVRSARPQYTLPSMISDTASIASSLDLSSLPDDPTTTYISLTRLLSRLEATILASRPARNLRHNPYERTKVGANLEHARTLLLRLEHDSSPSTSRSATPKPLASRVSSGLSAAARNHRNGSATTPAASKADLAQKRQLIKQLQDALHTLDDQDHPSTPLPSADASTHSPVSSDQDSDSGDDEDILARYAPAIKTSSSINTDRGASGQPLNPQNTAAAAAAASMVASSLRARTGANTTAAAPQATATGRAGAAPGPRQSLPTTVPFAPAPSRDAASSHAQLLESHDAEQDALTSSLLNLASALKQSTMSFSESILGSESVVDQAAAALDKNVGGMEAASNRMGLLRKVTEGRGWWARLGLYAKIGVLWVVIILLVFVAPKLRF